MGELTAIDTLRAQTGGAAFQGEVWRALREISCGTTLSYATLAARIGRPNAVTAVGLANGSNPVGVVVPCHRVIGSDGSLTGYGGGIERKRWLLEYESRHAPFRLHAYTQSGDPCPRVTHAPAIARTNTLEKGFQIARRQLCGLSKEGMKDVAGFLRETRICDTNNE